MKPAIDDLALHALFRAADGALRDLASIAQYDERAANLLVEILRKHEQQLQYSRERGSILRQSRKSRKSPESLAALFVLNKMVQWAQPGWDGDEPRAIRNLWPLRQQDGAKIWKIAEPIFETKFGERFEKHKLFEQWHRKKQVNKRGEMRAGIKREVRRSLINLLPK
jgi:hypothetical protein